MAHSLRCLLVEDQLIYQEPLAAMLSRQPGLKMVGFASCAASAIKACSELLPDLLILDLGLHAQDVPVVARAFSLLNPEGRVIVLSSVDDSAQHQPPELHHVIAAIVDRRRGLQELLNAILSLLPDQSFTRQPRDLEQLTARECEVLHCIGSGLSPQAIADQLGITLRTVSTHRQNIAAKLELSGHALVHQATLLVQDGALSCRC